MIRHCRRKKAEGAGIIIMMLLQRANALASGLWLELMSILFLEGVAMLEVFVVRYRIYGVAVTSLSSFARLAGPMLAAVLTSTWHTTNTSSRRAPTTPR